MPLIGHHGFMQGSTGGGGVVPGTTATIFASNGDAGSYPGTGAAFVNPGQAAITDGSVASLRGIDVSPYTSTNTSRTMAIGANVGFPIAAALPAGAVPQTVTVYMLASYTGTPIAGSYTVKMTNGPSVLVSLLAGNFSALTTSLVTYSATVAVPAGYSTAFIAVEVTGFNIGSGGSFNIDSIGLAMSYV